jgi:serine phosphatase RsbU (regulator of sigma subunit)
MKQNQNMERLQQLADEEAILKQIAEIRAKKQQEELQKLHSQLDEATKDLNQFDADKVRLSDALSKTQLQLQFLEAESENEKLRNEEEMRRAKALRNLLMLGAISFMIISFFIYRNYKHEQRSKKALAEKNEQIEKQNHELESLNKIIAKHNERMQTELNVGREIQMSMIPSYFPKIKGIDLFAAIEPALEVGGDLYDFFKLDDHHWVFGVGDVSEKGVPAALFMAVTKTLVKTNANYSALPSQILSQVNKELSLDNDSSMFVTYYLCVLNTETGELSYTNAGHNPPLYIRKNGKLEKLDELHGPVLGAVEDFAYKQGTLKMEQGDQLILYTDGVTEAMNSQNVQYSNERLDDIFSHNGKHNSKESVDAIIKDIQNFRGQAEQSDDITILSVIYTGV